MADGEIWFGTTEQMVFVKAPETVTAGRRWYSESSQFDNGGGDESRSAPFRRSYDLGYGWSDSADASTSVEVFADFVAGEYGPGPFYLADPMFYGASNLFAPGWASARLIEAGWKNFGPSTPVFSDTAANANGQPTRSATWSIATTANAVPTASAQSHVIPIPPTHTLWLGVSGSKTGDGAVQVQTGPVTALVRTNQIRDPDTTATTLWNNGGGASTLSIVSGRLRVTSTGGGDAPVRPVPATPRYPVVSGNAWALKVKVTPHPSKTLYVRLSNNYYDAANAATNPAVVNQPLVAIPAGVVDVDLELFGVVPAVVSGNAIAGMLPFVYFYSTAGAGLPASGDYLDYSKWDFETGATAPTASPMTYVAGSLPASFGRVYAWVGTVNASMSTMTTVQNVAPMTLLSPTASTRLNASIDGSLTPYVRVFLGRTAATTSTVTIASMMAQLWPTGVTPTLTGNHIRGRGHTGLEFVGSGIDEQYLDASPGRRYKALSVELAEVGAWRP